MKERHKRSQRTAGKARRRKTEGTVPRTGLSGARKKPHSNGAPWTGTSGGTQADMHTEPGLEHLGKNVPAGNRATRTGTSGGQMLGTGTTGEEGSGPGKERQASRAEHRGGGHGGKKSGGPVKENMNRNKERKGEETKNMNSYERREGEATDRNIRGQEEATQQRGPLGWNTRGVAVASGQAHGGRAETSGEERKGRHRGHQGWSIRGAESQGWDKASGEYHGMERPGLHGKEEAAAARKAGGQSRRV